MPNPNPPNNKGKKYLTQKMKFEQQLASMGIDVKSQTIKPSMNNGTNGHGGGEPIPAKNSIKIDIANFSMDDIKKARLADKEREKLKAGQQSTENIEVEYVKFEIPEVKEEPKKQTEEQKKDAEEEERKRLEKDFLEQWEGFDGEMIIYAFEMFNGMVAPKISAKMKRELPTPEDLEFTVSQKKLMKPGADKLMLKIIKAIKRPEYMMLAVGFAHVGFTCAKQKKIVIEETFYTEV